MTDFHLIDFLENHNLAIKVADKSPAYLPFQVDNLKVRCYLAAILDLCYLGLVVHEWFSFNLLP